jgi:hypothetical protein
MSGPSRSLLRIGVVAVSALALGIGAAPVASAAPPPFYPPTGNGVTSVQVSPEQDTANVDICNPYMITMTGGTPSASVTVEVRQTAQATAVGDTLTIGFCSPIHGNDSSPPPGVMAQPSPDSANSNSTGDGCETAPSTAQNTSMTEGCQEPLYDQDGDHTIIVGVKSDHPGTMAVHAFTDTNGDGTEQVSEQAFTAHKTWTAADPASNSNHIACSPQTATNPSGTTHNFDCTVTDNAGQPVAGARVNFKVTSGPDAGQTGRCGTTSDGTSFEPGTSGCQYKNSGPVGHDAITAWIDTTDNNLQDSGEPSTTLSKDWVQPAPNGSTLTLTCSPNQTTTSGDDPTCQEDTSTSSVTITALVQNGTPAQPQADFIVLFDQPQDTSPAGKSDASDTESVSPTQCTTDAQGKCSVTFTDSSPSDGEEFTVDASLPRQGQADDTATATIVYHNPTKGEARNIDVTPNSASKEAGGVQTFVAAVSDRFDHPVPGVLVSWTETGPGSFRAGGGSTATCTTGADGSCSVETTSLQSETGDQEVTGTIDSTNYSGATNQECMAPANKTYVAPASSTSPGDAPGAQAGNCSDKGSVTWTKPVQTQDPDLNCFSPKRHVLKCKVVSHPRVAGADVTFRKVHKDGSLGRIIAEKTTNSNGVAKFRKAGLKSGKVWRVIAKVHSHAGVKGGLSNKDRTRIK